LVGHSGLILLSPDFYFFINSFLLDMNSFVFPLFSCINKVNITYLPTKLNEPGYFGGISVVINSKPHRMQLYFVSELTVRNLDYH
jgi:hypothetical protein